MIQITLHFSDVAAAAAFLAKANGAPAAPSIGVTADEKTMLLANPPKAEARGKPSAATTAPSPPTAAAAPSQPAPSAAAPAPRAPEATPPAAAANSASPQVAYSDLQKAVLTLHKMDPTAALPIAKSLGAETFKALPEAKWAEALALVQQATADRQVA